MIVSNICRRRYNDNTIIYEQSGIYNTNNYKTTRSYTLGVGVFEGKTIENL
jgi:hypothetical protein